MNWFGMLEISFELSDLSGWHCSEPGSKAHGWHTFCGVATMVLIDEVNRLDLPRLIDWLVFQQGKENGFSGRTNKLVDCCITTKNHVRLLTNNFLRGMHCSYTYLYAYRKRRLE
ncbi:hypothetical protein ACFX2J_043493 [Malus domestica]